MEQAVEGDQAAFAEAANLGAVTDLLAEIQAAHAKLEELSRQKAALGFD